MNTRAALSLHHVLVAASRGAPEVEPLRAAGFTEGPPNTHPGQGTACRRFFFDNAYLEFAWVEDDADVRSPLVRPTGLGDRLEGTREASRIGLCVRLAPDRGDLPVPTWPYRPPYVPAGLSIQVARNSARLEEPLLFFIPHALSGKSDTPGHRNGARAISRVEVVLPRAVEPSFELAWLAASGLVDVTRGDAEAVRVEVDGGARGSRVSVPGETPLEIVW